MPPERNELPPSPLTFATHVLPAALYSSAIFYGGLIRIGALPEVGLIGSDKLLHALAFGGLALLVARAAHWFRPHLSLAKKLLAGCVGSSALGMSLELCQALTVYRSADIWDWVADSVGALLAIGAALLLFACVPRRAHG